MRSRKTIILFTLVFLGILLSCLFNRFNVSVLDSVPKYPEPPPPAQIHIDLRQRASKLDKEFREQLEEQRKAQELYEKAIKALPMGESFHNVPPKMKANVPILIKAGIAPDVTEQLLKQLYSDGLLIFVFQVCEYQGNIYLWAPLD